MRTDRTPYPLVSAQTETRGMSLWESWREVIDRSVRDAESSRARHEERHLRELDLGRGASAHPGVARGFVERSAAALLRAAQAAAAWLV